MNDEIRARLRSTPFEPFTIYLADGRTLKVPHEDFVWMPKPGALYYYHEETGGAERINPLLIASILGGDSARSQ